MTPKELVSRLQKIDKRLRVCWSPNKVSGLYFYQPGHPDAHENGLRHIGAIASASWFLTLPMKDFYTKGEKFRLSGPPPGADIMQWEYHRGWKSTLRLLGEQGHFSKYKLGKEFGWDIFVMGVGGILSKLPGLGELTKGQKAKKELGMDPFVVPRLGAYRRTVVAK